MNLSNVGGNHSPKISTAIQTAALSHHLTVPSIVKAQTISQSCLSEVERLANAQKEECIIQNDRIKEFEFSLNTCKSNLRDSERLSQEEKFLADQNESLLQQELDSTYQKLADLQEKMKTEVVKSTQEKIAACQQVEELQGQKLLAEVNAHMKQNEKNALNYELEKLQLSKLQDDEKVRAKQAEVDNINLLIVKLQLQKRSLDEKNQMRLQEIHTMHSPEIVQRQVAQKQELEKCLRKIDNFHYYMNGELKRSINDLLEILKFEEPNVEDFENRYKWHIDLGKHNLELASVEKS